MLGVGRKKPLERDILYAKVNDEGLFEVPAKDFTEKEEVMWAKRRMDSLRLAYYADSKCGLPNTYDKDGAYLCGGTADGKSSPCNKFVTGGECLISITRIDEPHKQSCGYWEVRNAGDPEARYCPKGRMEDKRIGFGETKSEKGFGCVRCEYGQNSMPKEDSEGRTQWCALKGHPVEKNACCEDNEPLDKNKVEN